MDSNRALGVTGVTWFDTHDDLGKGEQTLAEIVVQVVKYHERRLGETPNLIQVHPSVVSKLTPVGDVWVNPQRHIIKRHYHAVCVKENLLPRKPAKETSPDQLVIEIGL